jgi:hypothetical protein
MGFVHGLPFGAVKKGRIIKAGGWWSQGDLHLFIRNGLRGVSGCLKGAGGKAGNKMVDKQVAHPTRLKAA